MATLATAVIQDLTYTEKSLGLGVSITYTNDGVAGAEVVSVSGHAISVKIQSGVSTATQIRAAVMAHVEASTQVTVVVSGTGSNAQVSCVNASIANGSSALKASKQIGGILYEAKTAGTAGNSITITYVNHAVTLSAVAAGSDITVTFKSGTTKMSAIMALIRADGACNTLVAVSQVVPDSEQYVSYASSAVNLVGGAAAIAGSVITQDLTYSSDLLDASRNGSKITYIPGATAGAEVVTVNGNDVSIQIENAVSTANQIKTAFDASEAADGKAATGSIVVSDYANLHATKASGTITVDNYAQLHLTKASGTITFGTPDVLTKASGTVTVVDYTKLHLQEATKVIQDLTYTAVNAGLAGNSITVEYVDDITGDLAVVEVTGNNILVHMDDTAVTGTTANTIKAAVNADPEALLLVLVSGASANVQAVQAATNLEDGQNAATLTAAGHVLTESTDWDAETSNDVTADNLALAIDGLSEVSAANPAAAAITVEATVGGTAGNSITLVTSDVVNLTISAGTLLGGLNASTVTVAGTTFTAVAATPGPTEFVVIADLTTLIEALSLVDATDDSSIITVVAHTAGTTGNSIAMSKTGAGLTLSGALLTGGINAATVTVAGHVLTESTEWNAATSNDATATSLASAIDGLTEVDSPVPGAAIVTINAASTGIAGNSITVATSDAINLLKSGATLAGGINAGTVTIAGHLLTESVEWTASVNNDTTAESLKTAIHALTEVNATRSTATVNIVAASKGSAGNAITIATNDAIRLLKSGTTLSGGTDKLQCTVSGTGSTAQITVNANVFSGGVGDGMKAILVTQATLALTSAYQLVNFGFRARQMSIINDESSGSNAVIYSYDGISAHGQLDPNEAITLDHANANGVYLKYGTGAPAYKLIAAAL